MLAEALGEEIVCQFPCLFETIDTVVDFKVYPIVVFVFREIVFVDEFLWDVRQFNADVFWSIQRCAEIEVGDVETRKLCVRRR